MRTEKEMYELILGFAEHDERVRAVTLGGSRANKNVPEDKFQDYDICYFVTDMDSFLQDDKWLDIFGKRIIMQKPEAMSLFPPELGGWFTYLMLFEDGNRIDLMLIPVHDSERYLHRDKLVKRLLDKDNLFPDVPVFTDKHYHINRPSSEFYRDCCNEFWWVSTYVAKGLWRKEILYANAHIEQYVRSCLLRMLEWKVGIQSGFSLSSGKSYKYLPKYLDSREQEILMSTYKNDTYENSWQSLFAMAGLFTDTSKFVADKLGYDYPHEESQKVLAYLKGVRLSVS